MLTTTQLENWALKNIGTSFIGVFAADTLPVMVNRVPASLIVNYDPHNLPGSHWVSCRISKDGVIWYDSFGLAPDANDIILGHRTYFHDWLSTVCRLLQLENYWYNTADLQSLKSRTCGHYALHFCSVGPKKGWGDFGPDQATNDLLIQRLVRLS
jgi:hypothetical protein